MSLWTFTKIAKILKRNNKYVIISESGKTLGEEDTYKAAVKRLRQIEHFKHKNAAMNREVTSPETALLWAKRFISLQQEVPHVIDAMIAEDINTVFNYIDILQENNLQIPEIINVALSATGLYHKANLTRCAKIIRYPSKDIPISKFNVSFNDLYKDYVIYFPDTVDQYVTRIGDVELGFGPRYLLKRLLYDVRKANPTGIVNTDYIEVRTIPELIEPIMRRLGKNTIVITDPVEKDKLVKTQPNTQIWHATQDPGQSDATETGDERNYENPNSGTQKQIL